MIINFSIELNLIVLRYCTKSKMIAFDSKMNRQPNSVYYWLQKIGTIFSLLVAIQIIREIVTGHFLFKLCVLRLFEVLLFGSKCML